MKIKALQDFNLGSMSRNHLAGDVVEVSESVAKELIAAGLAKEVEAKNVESKPSAGASSAPASTAKADKPSDSRTTKEDKTALKNK